MRFFLKLADGEQYFEEVDKYTFDNHKFALSDDGQSPRYLLNDWVMVNENGTLSVQLCEASARDLPILARALHAPVLEREATGKGFVREPETIKFRKGKTLIMRELATGEEWRKVA